MIRILVALAGALFMLALAGCGEPEPLRIGIIGELSGRSPELAEAARNGALMAIDAAQASGKLKGRRVDVLVRDTGPSPETAASAARELVAAKVVAIIGPITSAMATAIQSVTEKSGIVLISPTVSSMPFYGQNDLLFRLNWTTRDSAINYAQHYHAKGLRRLSVAANENNRAYSESWLKEFSAAFEALGGSILTSPYFDSGSDNYTEIIDIMLASRPDGLLFIGNAVDVPRLAQQAYKVRPGIAMIAVDWAGTSQLIELGGKAVEGLFLVHVFDQDNNSPGYLVFRDAYLKRFGKLPVLSSVLGYEAASILLDALIRRPESMTIKEALLGFGPYQGLQQQISFDANGDVMRTPHFMVVRNGRFVPDR